MKKLFLSLLLFSTFLLKILAQDTIKTIIIKTDNQKPDTVKFDRLHIFSISTGYSSHAERYEAVSPFIYRGTTSPFGIDYKYVSTRSLRTFSAYFDQLKLTSSIPNYNSYGLTHYIQSYNFYIDYSYNRKLFIFSEIKTMLFVGGKIESLFNLGIHNFLNGSQEPMLDQFNSIDLNIIIEKKFANEKNILLFNYSMPLMSYVLMRGTYNGNVSDKINPSDFNSDLLYIIKNGDFVTFNKLFKIKADFSYVRFFCKHFGLELKYSFNYYSFNQYNNLFYSNNLDNQFLIGVFINF
jgi:hypothetical protein